MIRASIWKDTYYTSTKSSLTYYIKIEDTDTIIFAGRAYKLPSDDEIRININGICRNYLDNDLRPLLDAYEEDGTQSAIADNALRTFNLYNADGDVLLESYEFLYDWSYDTNHNGITRKLSKPINGRRTSEMYCLGSVLSLDNVVNDLFMFEYYKPAIESCSAEYAIYYLNSYGGWDSFLFEGKSSKKDTITQYTTDRAFVNTTLDYEAYRYVSEISTSYTLSTSWLTDEQSENFAKNLVGSNHVYLHDLKNDEIFSAIITDTSVTYQKQKNNNGKLAVYTLNVKRSQNKLRG